MRRVSVHALHALVVLLLAPLSVAVAPAASSQERGGGSWRVTARDVRGDVEVLDPGRLSRAEARSIDVRRVQVRPRGRTVRFRARIKDVVRRDGFHQVVVFGLRPVRGDAWYGSVSLSTRGRAVATYGSTVDDHDQVYCYRVRARVQPRKDAVYVDVPRGCLPERPARLRVLSYTGQFWGNRPPASRDRLAVAGVHRLRAR